MDQFGKKLDMKEKHLRKRNSLQWMTTNKRITTKRNVSLKLPNSLIRFMNNLERFAFARVIDHLDFKELIILKEYFQ